MVKKTKNAYAEKAKTLQREGIESCYCTSLRMCPASHASMRVAAQVGLMSVFWAMWWQWSIWIKWIDVIIINIIAIITTAILIAMKVKE